MWIVAIISVALGAAIMLIGIEIGCHITKSSKPQPRPTGGVYSVDDEELARRERVHDDEELTHQGAKLPNY